MAAFGAQMSRHGMIQNIATGLLQAGRRRTTDKAVQHHGNTGLSRPRNRPCHRRQFTPPKTPQRLQAIAARHRVHFQTSLDNPAFVSHTHRINARPTPDPISRLATKEC